MCIILHKCTCSYYNYIIYVYSYGNYNTVTINNSYIRSASTRKDWFNDHVRASTEKLTSRQRILDSRIDASNCGFFADATQLISLARGSAAYRWGL